MASYDDLYDKNMGSRSKWNPKTWPRWALWTAIGATVVVVVAVIVGAVLGTKSGAYPDYGKLTYSLEDTYSGTDFFDNFDYFTGYDPSAGFVQYVKYCT